MMKMMNSIIYMKIDSYYQLKQIIELLKEHKNILVECDKYDYEHYLIEAIYALKGTIKKISRNQYLLEVDKGE